MKILIHASLDFRQDIICSQEYINKNSNYEVILPDLHRYQYIRDDLGDDITFTKIKNKLTIQNFRNVVNCDVLLILNYTHRGIKNYVGGNSFMEMVLAYYLNKPIYLLNDIPNNMTYSEEIKALYPIVIHTLSDFIISLKNLR